jgi:hypothetical protein
VVRRGLDRDVEGDLEAVVGGGADEVSEVVERAELGLDRVVTALG